jgi:hypothetical protein
MPKLCGYQDSGYLFEIQVEGKNGDDNNIDARAFISTIGIWLLVKKKAPANKKNRD